MKVIDIVAMIAILAISLLAIVQPGQAGVTCGQVDAALMPCVGYLTGLDGDTPSTACCAGINLVKEIAQMSVDNMKASCNCVKAAAMGYAELKTTAAQTLPAKCGFQMDNILVSRTLDCDKIDQMQTPVHPNQCPPNCCGRHC